MGTGVNKKRYVTDLKELHSMAERNYVGLLRILPDQVLPKYAVLSADDQEQPLWRIKVGQQLDFEITLGLQAPYTTDVIVKQRSDTKRVEPKANQKSKFHQVE